MIDLSCPSCGEPVRVANEMAGREVPVVVFDASDDADDVAAYDRLGVERLLFTLPTTPEAQSLRRLDALADVVAAAG